MSVTVTEAIRERRFLFVKAVTKYPKAELTADSEKLGEFRKILSNFENPRTNTNFGLDSKVGEWLDHQKGFVQYRIGGLSYMVAKINALPDERALVRIDDRLGFMIDYTMHGGHTEYFIKPGSNFDIYCQQGLVHGYVGLLREII